MPLVLVPASEMSKISKDPRTQEATPARVATHSLTAFLVSGRAGLSLAREVCAVCHAVSGRQTLSPDPEAPTFGQIARVPGMTPLALTVALQTSHKTMPNIMLKPDELRDLAAYITSLKDQP